MGAGSGPAAASARGTGGSQTEHIADLKARGLSGEHSTGTAPLSADTAHKHLVVLRQALAEAAKPGLIVRNATDAASAPSVKAPGERRVLTEDEITALLAAATGTRFDAPIRFTVSTGVRKGKLLAIKWADVDLDSGTVTIRRTAPTCSQYRAGSAMPLPHSQWTCTVTCWKASSGRRRRRSITCWRHGSSQHLAKISPTDKPP